MSERTKAIIEEDLENFQKKHSPLVAVFAGVGFGMGVLPGILAAAAGHGLEPVVTSTAVVTSLAFIHLDSSRRTLASLREELKRIGA